MPIPRRRVSVYQANTTGSAAEGLQVATFLVLRELPGVTRDQYAAAQQAAIDAASQSSTDARPVRYLGGFFIPSAGRAVCIFRAHSLADVAAVNQHARVPFTEVLEAIEMPPIGEAPPVAGQCAAAPLLRERSG